MHENPDKEVRWHLSQRINRWLRWYDGCHVLNADKSEAVWYNIMDRGFNIEQNTAQAEFNPEYVHHNYLHTDAYRKSREERGVEGANPN